MLSNFTVFFNIFILPAVMLTDDLVTKVLMYASVCYYSNMV